MQEKEIIEMSKHCLNCKIKPCSLNGCPLKNDIPSFINEINNSNYHAAYEILLKTTVLSGVCGRICPHTKQCQGACVRGIKGEPVSIGKLESYVFDKVHEDGKVKQRKNSDKDTLSKKVAIIGGGPAGLTAAAFLARENIDVTIFEKYNYLGGLLLHGIPDFRLPKKVVKDTIDEILELGIKVEFNKELGKNLDLDFLKANYDYIFLSIGANLSSKMNVKGEHLQGVFGGNELLESNEHPNYKDKTVIVIGGGNVAMDCARTIKRLGAKEVKIIYRRSREEMPAEDKEIDDAIIDGVDILFQNNIVEIFGKEKVEEVELVKTELILIDGENRLVPVNIEDSNYNIKADYVVMSIGSKAQSFVSELGLATDKYGKILINEKYETSDSQIYAGGDIAGVKSTVAWASYSGREAAKNIIEAIYNLK